MMLPTYGDMASRFQLGRQTTSLKTQMATLSEELTTQKTADVQKHLGGNYSTLAGLERSLRLQSAYRMANKDAGGFAEAQQLALESIHIQTEAGGSLFLSAAASVGEAQLDAIYTSAGDQFASIVSRMNTRWGDRTIFAGAATQGASVADAETILTELRAAISGETTAAGIQAAADAWFDTPGGGFETLGYLGSSATLAPAQIAEGERVSLDITASDSAFRETLKAFALTSLAGDGALAGNRDEQRKLLEGIGGRLVNTSDALVELQASVGNAQERIENASVRMEAERTALTLAMNALTGADPYETAVKLEAVQTQLETVFTLTARMSRLSLASALG